VTKFGAIHLIDPSRAAVGDDAPAAQDLRALAACPTVRALQFSRPASETVWRLVNDEFLAARPDVEVRVYGHYTTTCDLGFVRLIPNARRFVADCLQRATSVESLAELPNLEALGLGIFDLEDFGVLERVPASLHSLQLSATRSKRPSLAPLRRFHTLKTLYIEGHSKDIEVLGTLSALEDLTLRSVTTPDLGFLAGLARLWSLDIKLGGIRDFSHLEGRGSIRYLELWQVRDLREIDFITRLPGLQNLLLHSLPHIASMPEFANAPALRRIVLMNLKALRDLSTLRKLPALEEFALMDGNSQTPEQLLPVLENPSVRSVFAGLGGWRKNAEFVRLRGMHGKTTLDPWSKFAYR